MSIARLIFSLLIATTVPAVRADFGQAFQSGPTTNGALILEATFTLVVPKPPCDDLCDEVQGGITVLWAGMDNNEGDLIQSVVTVDKFTWPLYNVYAYTLFAHGSGDVPDHSHPVQGPMGQAGEGNHVRIKYSYNKATGEYTQRALVNDALVSTLTTGGGPARNWDTSVECAGGNQCGTVPAHRWIDVYIILDTPDPGYGGTVRRGLGVTGDLTTQDGGLTWHAPSIYIPEYTFQ